MAYSDFRHSTAYHSYYQDYMEVRVPKKKGKGYRIERVYNGKYYRQDVTDRRWIQNKVLYAVLYVFAVAAYLLSATFPITANYSSWYVALAGFLTVVALILLLAVLFFYIISGRDMTIGTYDSTSLRLKWVSLAGAVCLGATALALSVFIVLNAEDNIFLELACLFGNITSGMAVLAINRLEFRIKYMIIPSNNKEPEDGVKIC